LDAFEQGDQDLLDQVVRRPIVTYLDNEVAKLSRDLQVPGGLSRPLPATYIPPPETIKGHGQNNDFPIDSQHQNDPYFPHNQEQKESLNDHAEKKSNYSHDQSQRNDRQESDEKEAYIIDDKFEVPPAGNQIHLPPSSTTIPVPSNFNQNNVIDDDDLC